MPDPFDAAAVGAAYDVAAEDYAEAFAADLLRLPTDREVLDSVAERSQGDSLVLDLGCGPGQVGQYLAARRRSGCWSGSGSADAPCGGATHGKPELRMR